MPMIIVNDCIEAMRELPENSVDAIVTDPPYGLEFMGKEWDKLDAGTLEEAKDAGGFQDGAGGNPYSRGRVRHGKKASSLRMMEWHRAWAEEAFRVLKPGGYMLVFGGSRTYHAMAMGVELAGFEIRDQIQWVYGSGFPKSRNIGRDIPERKGWGTALKPAHEPIVMARKPFSGTVAANVLEHGTGAINVDGCRVGDEKRYNPPAGNDRNPDTATGPSQKGGFGMSSNTEGREAAGRWPANLIHDGSDEVTDLLGEAARFFYCPKANKKEKNAGLGDFETKQSTGGGGLNSEELGGKFGSIKAPAKNHHPTVKPVELMRYLCRLVTPPGGTVLDPFVGSGTTGVAAIREGFEFIGIEREQEYADIATARIAAE